MNQKFIQKIQPLQIIKILSEPKIIDIIGS